VTDDRLVSRDSAAYQEFARLYLESRAMRSSQVDRWSGDLYATDSELWGAFNPKTGDIRLSEDRVLRHLTATAVTEAEKGRQAEALATVLHESVHAGMETNALAEPNAVLTEHSLGLMEGFAEVRAVADFDAFARRAGYPGLTLDQPQYPGAHAATESMLAQASGPSVSRKRLIDEALRGPGVMHFDQLAKGVVQNRLADVVPQKAEDQLSVRAALIETMKHNAWPALPHSSAKLGKDVGEEIRPRLNSKVDEIKQHYAARPSQPFPSDPPNPHAARIAVPAAAQAAEHHAQAAVGQQVRPELRFLSGQAPASQATRHIPSLGDGARGLPTTLAPTRIRAGSTRQGPHTSGRE
jgi:hypothetical protein